MRIRWTKKSAKNLAEVAEYIRKHNPQAASKIADRLKAAVRNLAENSHIGRIGRVTGTRELIVSDTNYIIPYHINKNKNEIEI